MLSVAGRPGDRRRAVGCENVRSVHYANLHIYAPARLLLEFRTTYSSAFPAPPRPAPPRVPPSLLVVSFANETQSLARKFHRSIAEISPLRLKTDGTFGRERSTGTIYLAHDTESLFFLSELPLNDPVPLPAYALQSFPEVLLQLFQLLQRSSLGIVVVCAHTKYHVYRYLLTRKQRTGR